MVLRNGFQTAHDGFKNAAFQMFHVSPTGWFGKAEQDRNQQEGKDEKCQNI